ncbi:aminotransferase class IV [Planosporangium mesophilum]|uniref:4-amino-4-deoxychorismate lyase n=1 Tax=Planosporangium mesophilum TaxID=689768 RepID=A0A8J3TAN8_9ACTN|nr:aminotransferase class IV [Planosporangium mesophilum]NJC80984.1 aminotransferase IV [Planosporangium mesophilum]GII21374.1 4-amino-4-deoxychorismate lyase [Planosporangium mesophilum]
MARVLALLGVGVVPADTPILRADDLGVLRGDGVFETIHVRDGEPWGLEPHLDRMARSAERLSMPLPPRADLVELAGQACAAWSPEVEGGLRIVCTRGPEDGGPVTAYATIAPVAAATIAARHNGVAVITATLGVPAEVRTEAPWLLGGAKTLSYAINMASLRWAAGQGADDVLWVSVDGYALEAPTSTLVWLVDGVLYTVPAATTGILAGTTAAYLLEHAGELGMRADERLIRPAELHDADGVWLTSSSRGLAEVRTLDGVTLDPSPETTRMRKLLGYS